MASVFDQSAAQMRSIRMDKQVEQANKDIASNPELKGATMLGTQFCDLGREKGTVLGNNLNDVRVMTSWYELDEHGQEVPGTATPWALSHVMANTNNFDDARACIRFFSKAPALFSWGLRSSLEPAFV